ncbi:hypothetical protein Pfo_007328 [Paulownia fortunei]|nr:hypothetical protein Pfo_007328 [Paulownia fortunei]
MEDHNVGNTIQQHAATVEPEVLQVPEAMEVGVGVEEKLENAGGVDDHGGVVASGASGGEADFGAKRKRGQPRKQPGEVRQDFMVVPEYSATPQKRGRGRPRGSGKWQTLAAALGNFLSIEFFDYLICHISSKLCILKVGLLGTQLEATSLLTQLQFKKERIWSFSQKIPESICIISALVLSPVQRFSYLLLTGHFTIVYLNGSHTYDEKRGGKICLLSVQLANPDGRFYGGAVAGSLIAAGPTQLIIATFRQKLVQQLNVRPHRLESQKPNKGTVAVPFQTDNGKLPDGEVKGLATAAPMPNPLVDDEVVIKGPNVSHASPQPVEWKSLQPSASVSERIMSDVDTGVTNY